MTILKKLNKVGVIGAGMMGAEIALCFAMSGCNVTLKDATIELAQKGKDRLKPLLDKITQKEKLEQRKFFFWYKPEFRKEIEQELRQMGLLKSEAGGKKTEDQRKRTLRK